MIPDYPRSSSMAAPTCAYRRLRFFNYSNDILMGSGGELLPRRCSSVFRPEYHDCSHIPYQRDLRHGSVIDGMPSHYYITHHYDLIQDRDTLDSRHAGVHVSQSLEVEVSLRFVTGCCTQQQLTSSSARLLPNAAYGGEDPTHIHAAAAPLACWCSPPAKVVGTLTQSRRGGC
jgi:hypothetical protein